MRSSRLNRAGAGPDGVGRPGAPIPLLTVAARPTCSLAPVSVVTGTGLVPLAGPEPAQDPASGQPDGQDTGAGQRQDRAGAGVGELGGGGRRARGGGADDGLGDGRGAPAGGGGLGQGQVDPAVGGGGARGADALQQVEL